MFVIDDEAVRTHTERQYAVVGFAQLQERIKCRIKDAQCDNAVHAEQDISLPVSEQEAKVPARNAENSKSNQQHRRDAIGYSLYAYLPLAVIVC